MFLSSVNLKVVEVASTEKGHGVMKGVHIAGDGTTVACNGGAVLLAAEPAREELAHLPGVTEQATVPAAGLTAEADVIKQALKNLPGKAAGAQAQYAALTPSNGGQVELTTVGHKLTQRVAATPMHGKYVDWQNVIIKAKGKATQARVAVNRKQLIQLLKVIDSACPDPGGDCVVFMELGGEADPIVLRANNYGTQQRVVGVLQPLNTQGRWPEANEWEAGLGGVPGGSAKGKRVVP